MNTLLSGLLLFCAIAVQAQEFNATGMLRSLSANRLVWVEQLSAGDPGNLVSAQITPQTLFEGCTPETVVRGAAVAVAFTSDSAGERTAQRVLFRTCREVVSMSGVVLRVDGETLVARNQTWDAPFQIGSEVRITIDPEGQAVRCSNEPMMLADLIPGAMFVASGEVGADDASVRAVYFATTDDCPLTTYVEGVVDGRSDTSLMVSSAVAGSFEAVVPISDNGTGERNPELLGLTTCIGEPVAWTQIAAGDTVQVLVTLYNDGRADLGGLTLLSRCPIDEPPFGRVTGVEGVLEISTPDSLVVRTKRGISVTVLIDATAFFGDCAGRAVERSSIPLGADVRITASRSGGALTLLYGFDVSSCSTTVVYAIVESNTDSQWTIRTESGRSAEILIDGKTKITDCAGRERQAGDTRFPEKRVRVALDVSQQPAVAQVLEVEADCPWLVNSSGVIKSITDTTVEIDTMGFEVILDRASTFFVDADGISVSWDQLQVGQNVCMQYTVLPGLPDPIRAIVLVGTSCTGEVGAVPLIASGIVLENDGTEMVVRTKGEDVAFAVTDNTSVMGAPTTASVAVGSAVKVTSTERLRSLEPVASMIEVLTATSVQENISAEQPVLLWPNPASTYLQVGRDDVAEVALVDVTGRRVLSTTQTTFDVSTVAAGMYLAQCRLLNGSVVMQMVGIAR